MTSASGETVSSVDFNLRSWRMNTRCRCSAANAVCLAQKGELGRLLVRMQNGRTLECATLRQCHRVLPQSSSGVRSCRGFQRTDVSSDQQSSSCPRGWCGSQMSTWSRHLVRLVWCDPGLASPGLGPDRTGSVLRWQTLCRVFARSAAALSSAKFLSELALGRFVSSPCSISVVDRSQAEVIRELQQRMVFHSGAHLEIGTSCQLSVARCSPAFCSREAVSGQFFVVVNECALHVMNLVEFMNSVQHTPAIHANLEQHKSVYYF